MVLCNTGLLTSLLSFCTLPHETHTPFLTAPSVSFPYTLLCGIRRAWNVHPLFVHSLSKARQKSDFSRSSSIVWSHRRCVGGTEGHVPHPEIGLCQLGSVEHQSVPTPHPEKRRWHFQFAAGASSVGDRPLVPPTPPGQEAPVTHVWSLLTWCELDCKTQRKALFSRVRSLVLDCKEYSFCVCTLLLPLEVPIKQQITVTSCFFLSLKNSALTMSKHCNRGPGSKITPCKPEASPFILQDNNTSLYPFIPCTLDSYTPEAEIAEQFLINHW